MVLQDIKNKTKERGFTIVELLVVIVVIAILAAITIVAYIGVTTRAKDTQALSSASTVQSYAEAYNVDNGTYPYSLASFSDGTTSARLSGASVVASGIVNGTAPSSPSTVMYTAYTSASATSCSSSNVVGGLITYYVFSTNKIATTTIGTQTSYTCTLT